MSRSWFYEQANERASSAEDLQLREDIEQIVLENTRYGYRRVTAQLRRDGWLLNHKRVLRVMRQESLLCQLKRSFVMTTDSAHGHRVYPNLLKGIVPSQVNQAWVADITYIRLPKRFCYLAAILDAYSRRCIGWKLSLEINSDLALAALDMALASRRPGPGLIHHSDRGIQYACRAYATALESAGARMSMSAPGNPYDNAKAESFFRTLKQEEVYLSEYEDFDDAVTGITHFIDAVYNHRRLHSSLGYRPPVEFETLQSYNNCNQYPLT